LVALGLSAPAFGEADLSNCEMEQIHLAGSIQPHGVLLLLREPDLVVVQASDNAEAFLGLDRPIIGLDLDALDGDLALRVRERLSEKLDVIPVAVRCRAGRSAREPNGRELDGLIHRPSGGGLVIELEPAGPPFRLSGTIENALRTILGCTTMRALCDEAAMIFKDLSGYDRVMVYRFDDDGHGEVFSEQREPKLEAFLGNRYPASDIPQIARRLYERNRIRILADVTYRPVPLTPRLSPITGRELDMSICFLRSMSPIHVQYLKNMGVGATLVISLVVGGRLWGLISCHHYSPRVLPFEIKAVCELLAETVATRIAALESFVQAQAELSVRRLEQRMIEAISRDGDWRGALFDGSQTLLSPLGASGAALLFDGQILTVGEVPGTLQLRAIGAWLDRAGPWLDRGGERAPVFATASLGTEDPDFGELTAVASGLAAAAISSVPGEYLLWFRPERVRTITWGGNPFKPIEIGDNPMDLSPRRSFSQWHQLMEGNAEPWNAVDLTAARLIGRTVADVVLQFRSVSMLIARTQFEQVRQQVGQSEQPVIIADAAGGILLCNEAFAELLPQGHATPRGIDDLLPFFKDRDEIRLRFANLVKYQQTWRGEIELRTDHGGHRPLLVRADPVFATPDRVLGFVLMFTDNTEQKEAASARRRFQDNIIERHRAVTGRIGPAKDLEHHSVLSAVVENAQLAALEITDRSDIERMPEKLESVRVSVARTTELLEHLIWHASRPPRKTPGGKTPSGKH
jgi:light-regulated signal transduction histidine kinase (bacteriophytochrome)